MVALMSKINRDIDNGIVDHDVPERIDVAVGSVINALLFGYRWDDVRNFSALCFLKLTL